MIWQRWPYILVMLMAACVMFALAAYGWRRRSAPAATAFAVLSLVVGCAGIIGALESAIPATAFDAKVAAKTLYAAWLAPAPVLLFIFAAQYTHRERWLTKGLLALIWGW
ncbi:MAG: hypothetical protein IPK16_26025 [Anaerolineales bacterium]|nr:hypothetical protein [Anaerolineales bacterium]